MNNYMIPFSLFLCVLLTNFVIKLIFFVSFRFYSHLLFIYLENRVRRILSTKLNFIVILHQHNMDFDFSDKE